MLGCLLLLILLCVLCILAPPIIFVWIFLGLVAINLLRGNRRA